MNGSPAVTIIMACRDHGRYLRQALESVFRQTWNDWEIILIDDGSTDQSVSIGRWYAQDERVRFIPIEGRGQSFAKSLGVRLARGQWLAFLDADDVWLPEKLAQHFAMIERQPDADVTWTDRILLYADGREVNYFANDGVITPERLWLENPIGFSTVVAHRRVFERFGSFTNSTDRSIDYDYWLRIAPHVCFRHIPQALTKYRIGHQQLSRNKLARLHALLQIVEAEIDRQQPPRLHRQRARASTLRSIGYFQKWVDRRRALQSYWQAFRVDYSPWRFLRACLGLLRR